jgi:NADPH:quinone reductase
MSTRPLGKMAAMEQERKMAGEFAGRTGAAMVMRQYGPPDVLLLERVALRPLAADEIRLRTLAAAINHSDLEIRAGAWPILRPDPFPYTPGLEAIGDIVEIGEAVSRFRVGERVITMMQGRGGVRARRPGGYSEYVVIAEDAAAPVPADLDVFDLAALGLAGVTAFEGLRKLGPLQGRRIAITSGAGFGPCVAALRRGGALSLVGAVAGGNVSFDAWRLLEVALTGYGSEELDGERLRGAIMAPICDWLRSDALAPPSRNVMTLAEAAAAHALLERHGVSGRVLLVSWAP